MGSRPLDPTELARSDTILAIDLGRYKCVACIYQRSTRSQAFTTLDTTADHLQRLFAKHPGVLVVIEACANSGWVHDLLAFYQELVGRRVRCQNRIRALFAGQGLMSPRGHRAWTEVGLAGLDLQANPLAECAPTEVWRGMQYVRFAYWPGRDDRSWPWLG